MHTYQINFCDVHFCFLKIISVWLIEKENQFNYIKAQSEMKTKINYKDEN